MKKTLFLSMLLMFFMACKKETKTSIIDVETDSLSVSGVSKDTIETERVVEKSVSQLKEELTAKGFQTFDYVDEKTQDTILMQQYFIAFLKSGPIRSQNEEEAEILQQQHQEHLGKMYELGYADISGPFGDNGDIRGITVYNVPTQKMADSLANSDPMVKSGRLVVEIHPWWAAKGYSLR
ncbi:hypothetical protein KO566_00360 [Flavobacteriaceae bacterium XHP0103]|uniref:YciI family protein n=1 Tax=Marixanthotalea marina TaxID=2844359 RepID=UPI002989B7CC|nr:hypothetical protein [Marixanthotalea marina]MBU3820497.1 hypothetical protein [Marixanthotalea marina]